MNTKVKGNNVSDKWFIHWEDSYGEPGQIQHSGPLDIRKVVHIEKDMKKYTNITKIWVNQNPQ